MDYQKMMEYSQGLSNFNTFIGMRYTDMREGHAEVEITLGEATRNPQGFAHGGIIFTLCDVAAGMAAVSVGRMAVTLNSSINFLRPGKGTKLYAVGDVIKLGKTVAVCEARVYDDDNRMVAKGDFSMYYTGNKLAIPGDELDDQTTIWGNGQ